jgi:hypothetical protein
MLWRNEKVTRLKHKPDIGRLKSLLNMMSPGSPPYPKAATSALRPGIRIQNQEIVDLLLDLLNGTIPWQYIAEDSWFREHVLNNRPDLVRLLETWSIECVWKLPSLIKEVLPEEMDLLRLSALTGGNNCI